MSKEQLESSGLVRRVFGAGYSVVPGIGATLFVIPGQPTVHPGQFAKSFRELRG